MEISQKIKGKNGQIIGIMVADVSYYNDCIVTIGLSLCHKNDKFDMQQGRLLANVRRYSFNDVVKLKDRDDDPMYLASEQFADFIIRCLQYYKDKSVIIPKIDWK